MPVYTVTTEMGRLDQEQKRLLAVGITRVHTEETTTGSPVHVIFQCYPKGAAWSAAAPAAPTIVSAGVDGFPDTTRERIQRRITHLMSEVIGPGVVTVFDDIPERLPASPLPDGRR